MDGATTVSFTPLAGSAWRGSCADTATQQLRAAQTPAHHAPSHAPYVSADIVSVTAQAWECGPSFGHRAWRGEERRTTKDSEGCQRQNAHLVFAKGARRAGQNGSCWRIWTFHIETRGCTSHVGAGSSGCGCCLLAIQSQGATQHGEAAAERPSSVGLRFWVLSHMTEFPSLSLA